MKSTLTSTRPRDVSPVSPAAIPPLENGDRLTREEFERRYAAMPNLKKAELIDGVVYVPSATRWRPHGQPDYWITGWLNVYELATPGVGGGGNTTLRLARDNEPQPDVFLGILPEHGGQIREDEEGYITTAPELIVEVTSSSVSYDLGPKLRLYQRSRAREYLVWRVLERNVDWFTLRQGRYQPLPQDKAGVIRSKVFPGLWLDTAALIAGEIGKVHEVLHQGLASPEHAAFVAKLRKAGRPSP